MSAPRRLAALKSHLETTAPAAPTAKFEDIPVIPRVAGLANEPRCKDKVVIITGANSALGIGRASAHQFAANGARAIYLCDFADSHLATHVREIQSLYPGVDAYARQFDAADEEAVKAVIKEALDTYGRLDVFFANAGIVGRYKPVQQLEIGDLEKVMRTNVTR
jgi:NAD(P)-dependent dehydrogenase (short-subunit alcohol dehydrogenase family)